VSTHQVALYLQIPAEYCRSFGGLRWAQYGEAIEFLDGPSGGRTFAFAQQVGSFLEGLYSGGEPVLGFGFALHLLYLVGLRDRASPSEADGGRAIERIAGPFRELGCPLRNAGALCAWLCRNAPATADPPELAEVHGILAGGNWVPRMVIEHPGLGALDQAEEPGMSAAEFEALVRREAESLSAAEIKHWLRHGRARGAPVDEPSLPRLPRRLALALAELEHRPRLAGIGKLACRMEAAICLPPRRLAWQELEAGGYADIATRGAPEQILPFQFALESDEFIRRFAEHELLFFRREEPRQPTSEELVILVDQGVRTWGDTRLLLAGAALALARQAERRGTAVKLAATSNDGEAVELSQIDKTSLCTLLETSDLSPHPGQALARLLQVPSTAGRDVVLLTHSRNLLEREVVAAAAAVAGDDQGRLFAVSVDARGQLELAELRRGLPVVLARSRIDPVPPETLAAVPSSSARPAYPRAWSGTFESIGFPFYTGALDELAGGGHPAASNFDFDDSGERILALSRNGLLFSCKIDGTDHETLPRPRFGDQVAEFQQTVIGVAGGFVIEAAQPKHRALVHYDFRRLTCTLYELEESHSLSQWLYYRDLHAVAGLPAAPRPWLVAIDLSKTGKAAQSSPRAVAAFKRAQAGSIPRPTSTSRSDNAPAEPGLEPNGRAVTLDPSSGVVRYRDASGREASVCLLSDGRPAWKGAKIVRWRQAGDVLALLADGSDARQLSFISISRATVLGTIRFDETGGPRLFALARDGRRVALLRGDFQIEVRDVPGNQPPILVTPRERLWFHSVTSGRSCLLVDELDPAHPQAPWSSCLIRWDTGRLELIRHDPAFRLEELGGPVAMSRSLPTANRGLGYDGRRFVQIVEHGGLRVLVDRYNHLAALGPNGDLVCMFYLNGEEVAAWMPDGTKWGSRRLVGGGPNPSSAERIATALFRAEWGEGRSA
jgi:hypothetical protein